MRLKQLQTHQVHQGSSFKTQEIQQLASTFR
jgi:hypothetical protein